MVVSVRHLNSLKVYTHTSSQLTHLMQVIQYSHILLVLSYILRQMSGTTVRMLYRQIFLMMLFVSVILTKMLILILNVNQTKTLISL